MFSVSVKNELVWPADAGPRPFSPARAGADDRSAVAEDGVFCKGNAACVAKQKQGVRDFLDILTRQRPPQPSVQKCLTRSSKKRVTDWAKAASCLRGAAKSGRKTR
jgi:hypothetical protein